MQDPTISDRKYALIRSLRIVRSLAPTLSAWQLTAAFGGLSPNVIWIETELGFLYTAGSTILFFNMPGNEREIVVRSLNAADNFFHANWFMLKFSSAFLTMIFDLINQNANEVDIPSLYIIPLEIIPVLVATAFAVTQYRGTNNKFTYALNGVLLAAQASRILNTCLETATAAGISMGYLPRTVSTFFSLIAAATYKSLGICFPRILIAEDWIRLASWATYPATYILDNISLAPVFQYTPAAKILNSCLGAATAATIVGGSLLIAQDYYSKKVEADLEKQPEEKQDTGFLTKKDYKYGGCCSFWSRLFRKTEINSVAEPKNNSTTTSEQRHLLGQISSSSESPSSSSSSPRQ
jgi:hypothetical protein